LLGDLLAFPNADVPDILDVRDRLTEARTEFRSAMAAAARDLIDVPADRFPAEVTAFRREHIDVARKRIDDELLELRAVPTLMRSLRETWAVPPVASLVVAAAMLDAGSPIVRHFR
jgi:hypothetical protein